MKKRQLITEADVRSMARQGKSILRIAPNAILTPLAIDAAQSAGIRFEVYSEQEASYQGWRIVLAVTRSAFRIKRAVVDVLRSRNITITEIQEAWDNDVLAAVGVAKSVVGKGYPFGIIVDGSGIQSCMVANRFEGIRAVNASETKHSQIARERYDANVLTLGAEFLTPSRAADIVTSFLDSKHKQ